MVKLHFSKRSLNPYHFAIGGLNESDLELLAGTMEGLLPVAYECMWVYRSVYGPHLYDISL